MTYSANFKEKTGSTSGEEPVYLLEISHSQLAVPVRVVRDNQNLTRGNYLSLPGTAGNYASTPDSAAVSVTGDIDIRVKMAMDDWTSAKVLFSKFSTGASVSWDFYTSLSGALKLLTSGNGTTYTVGTSSVAVGAADGSVKWVRVTRVSATGVIKFYTSDDGVSWTQLGTDSSNTAGAIFDGTDEIRIGSDTASWLPGKIYSAELRNGIDGPVVAKFDAAQFAIDALTAVMPTGETWTVNQSGIPAAAIAADETYIALAFDIQKPSDVGGQLARIPIRIDNVGRELTQWLDASNGGQGATARVMQVMRDDPDTLEFDMTLDLLGVKQNSAFVTGELGYENTLALPALVMSYRPDNTPPMF